MVLRFSRIIFFVIALVFVSSFQAHAIGLGAYLQGGGGSSEWEADDLGGSFDFETDSGHAGLGVVFDTNLSEDRLMNYRVQLGYERAVHDPDNHWGDIRMDSVVLDQDVGFGFYRTPRMRFWAGPEVRLSYSKGSPKHRDDYEFRLWGFGIGPVAGMNFNISSAFSICVKAGLLAIGYGGELKDDSDTIDDEDYAVSESLAFVNVSFMFRAGEKSAYAPRATRKPRSRTIEIRERANELHKEVPVEEPEEETEKELLPLEEKNR